MKKTDKPKFFEKYAWILFLIIGFLVLIGAIPHTLGNNTDPGLVITISGYTIEELQASYPDIFNLYDFYFRGGGLSDLGFAVLMIVLSLTAFRTGQKWSWYTFWVFPAYFLSWIFLCLPLPEEARAMLIPPLTVLTAVCTIGLILPVRIFLGKEK